MTDAEQLVTLRAWPGWPSKTLDPLGPTFTFGRAQDIVDGRRFVTTFVGGTGDAGRTYDVSPDGQRFLVMAPANEAPQQIGCHRARARRIQVVDCWKVGRAAPKRPLRTSARE